jgi:hypothetical protein
MIFSRAECFGIVFPPSSEAEVMAYDIGNPYISGFEHARPDASGKSSESPDVRMEWEIYRHPDYQGIGNRKKARKTYDIYSLGVIMVEIAHWRQIGDIMNVDFAHASLDKTNIRDRLLAMEPEHLEKMKTEMGEDFVTVARQCLTGARGFGLNADDDETGLESNAIL